MLKKYWLIDWLIDLLINIYSKKIPKIWRQSDTYTQEKQFNNSCLKKI